ncbi:MAG: NADH:ubiquinone reductase (Na(+)-transporting) subunit D [Gammaproteobacteria bacterium]|nr:NADH:ubiquinone reductase (Na(+)-transporting) subunit D [Gammaproteobacteria bacterium]MDH4254274.1 NADH:ubiquinone reductase (Na(+)-transporting) subunit D [Gammaproteobacteria bacterium]MDH5311120.1 NADH:ubiquinone reductase (Na(+)-transporting) subunit D [Gammaproteobacteria bacterium]
MRKRDILLRPLVDENPITLQILGICSALAISNTVLTALTMSAALTSVLVFSNLTISLLRRQLPSSVRLIVQVTIVASAVIIVDEILRAYAPEMSRALTVYVGLIITNCIVLGRAEAFAMSHRVGESILDAIGNGLGYSAILVAVAVVRELLGAGSLLGIPILPLAGAGGWFRPVALMLVPASAFFIIALIIWAVRSRRKQQVEAADFRPCDLQERTR